MHHPYFNRTQSGSCLNICVLFWQGSSSSFSPPQSRGGTEPVSISCAAEPAHRKPPVPGLCLVLWCTNKTQQSIICNYVFCTSCKITSRSCTNRSLLLLETLFQTLFGQFQGLFYFGGDLDFMDEKHFRITF